MFVAYRCYFAAVLSAPVLAADCPAAEGAGQALQQLRSRSAYRPLSAFAGKPLLVDQHRQPLDSPQFKGLGAHQRYKGRAWKCWACRPDDFHGNRRFWRRPGVISSTHGDDFRRAGRRWSVAKTAAPLFHRAGRAEQCAALELQVRGGNDGKVIASSPA